MGSSERQVKSLRPSSVTARTWANCQNTFSTQSMNHWKTLLQSRDNGTILWNRNCFLQSDQVESHTWGLNGKEWRLRSPSSQVIRTVMMTTLPVEVVQISRSYLPTQHQHKWQLNHIQCLEVTPFTIKTCYLSRFVDWITTIILAIKVFSGVKSNFNFKQEILMNSEENSMSLT